MSSAFRHLGLRPDNFKLLLMKAKNPLDGATYYFVEKCLPFGASISCSHFQRFSNCIAHIITFKTGKPLINFLDDYLFAALMRVACNEQVKVFMDVCQKIRFPFSEEKTYWGTNHLTFLGLLLDTLNQCVCIPAEKIEKAKSMIGDILAKGNNAKVTMKQLQKICGFLNFLSRCVVPGRVFTRRLYAYTSGANLKPHHHIRINKEMRLDLTMWYTFICHPTIYCHPFMDFSEVLVAEKIFLYSDTSGKIGWGVISDKDWMHGTWNKVFLEDKNPSIEYLELFALLAGVIKWLHKYRNCRIVLYCDNQSVVDMVNSNSSTCKNCMILIRLLVLKSMIENVRIFAAHVRTARNTFTDLLSRNKIQAFKTYAEKVGHEVSDSPSNPPDQVWPMEHLWIN